MCLNLYYFYVEWKEIYYK